MKFKIIGLLSVLAFLILTLIVIAFTVKIQEHVPAQLHVLKDQTYLVFNAQQDEQKIKNKKSLQLYENKTKKRTTYFRTNFNPLDFIPSVSVQNVEHPYSEGIYFVSVFVKTETFAKHYLGI
ncbi:hypothetical protein [[Mycoplasma] testudinis]|uniref:hypothetical protein n=1 Tax=[Mycoplasma] testudinis TaxID=33924 RepID=UPI0004883A94|nr:hypothetical protein [[Mycoplasma] testudinis]